MSRKLARITKEPLTKAKYCVIWLHGLGANGEDFSDAIPALGLPPDHTIRFIFPHAFSRPVTMNGGRVMPAWYDILKLKKGGDEDLEGIERSAADIFQIMDEQRIDGIALKHIFLVGFSQGGALALYSALRYPGIGGLAMLSSYVAAKRILNDYLEKNARETFPVFIGHGLSDSVLPIDFSKDTKIFLTKFGFEPTMHIYNMVHTVCLEEFNDLGAWLMQKINVC